MLSYGECQKILENAQGSAVRVKLLDYRLVRDLSAIGYLGDYYALTLRYCHEEEEIIREIEFFVKAMPQQSAELAKESIFQKESWLYDTLIKKLQALSNVKWSPDCVYSRKDLMVLENIKLKGFTAAGSAELNEKFMKPLIKSVAAFHSASLVYEHQTKTNIGHTYGDNLLEITVDSEIAWFTTGLSAVLAVVRSLDKYQGNREQSFIDDKLMGIMGRIYEQAAPSKKYRNVLCHRDLWAGNIFFPPENSGPALLIDFQTCRYAPPASDLNFCLYMNLSSSKRTQMEKRGIDLYHTYMLQNLLELGLEELAISKSELLESYEEFRLFGVVYRAVAATVVKVPTDFVTNDFKYVDRSKVILSYMKTSPEFAAYMEECCVDVMEMALARANM
ncbi:uncharacterized protein LOC6733031 isoform X1 [Drosophila simulans]|uniref:CHK kinase-like domain-containing protein n=2 Tax=Drosophila simulans TaxID=7240 RepID=A0A0J9TSF8_DROSI|nr:uncharacterized protein LOC6733031 isoform X1 [Drosophila simulans]KMY91270.1 uncharacterized protein Dsimw501_GD21657 [Drosophila simulans]